MRNIRITKKNHIHGEITVPGDKSISHRGILLGAISSGITRLTDFLDGADCRSTISCLKKLGTRITKRGSEVLIYGKGMHSLSEPDGILDVGNSGTTMRLLSGILSACDFSSVISGDESIQKRPMNRIIEPLSLMGGAVSSQKNNGCAPLLIEGRHLLGIDYKTPVASAQVKSCILLAGLFADGDTTVTEPAPSRDHTERMLSAFGADISCSNTTVKLHPGKPLFAQDIKIPGDISSAAPFLCAGLLAEKGELLIKNVGINLTRAGILSVINQMGGKIQLLNKKTASGEETADIAVFPSSLSGTVIEGEIIPSLIDELPVIAVMAAFAKGKTIVKDAGELKVKESDRIALLSDNLTRMGCDFTPTDDGFIIEGGKPLKGALIHTAHDHRMAMAFAAAALSADGETTFDDEDCVSISYPGFFDELNSLF